MTEVVLLGNVALRARAPIQWNARKMKVTNLDSANQWVGHAYRRGWHV